VLAVLLGFVVLIAAALAIPVALKFRVAWPDTERLKLEVGWAFGLVRFRIDGAQGARSSSAGGRQSPRRRRRNDSSKRKLRIASLVRDQRFRRRLARFVGRTWRALGKDRVRIHLRIGLDDPADTGRLWAVLGPASALLADVREAALELQPDFHDEVFQLDGSGSVRVVPLHLLLLAAGLAVSPVVWRGLWQARAAA